MFEQNMISKNVQKVFFLQVVAKFTNELLYGISEEKKQNNKFC